MTKYRACAYLKRLFPSEKVSELYDDDEMLRMALSTLLPGFEYPDVAHLTIGEVLRRSKG